MKPWHQWRAFCIKQDDDGCTLRPNTNSLGYVVDDKGWDDDYKDFLTDLDKKVPYALEIAQRFALWKLTT